MANCLSCKTGVMAQSPDYNGLVTWTKRPDGGIDIHGDRIVPVKISICQSCGHIEMKYVNPNNVN